MKRRRFLELVLMAVVLFAAIYVAALFTVPVQQEPVYVNRTLEDLRVIDAATDQYALENAHPASTPAPATPSSPSTTPSSDTN